MPRYNPAAKCPKCGHDKVETAYQEVFNLLKRTCERCGYNWHEDPLDAVEALPAPEAPVLPDNNPVIALPLNDDDFPF